LLQVVALIPTVVQEIKELINERGKITFAEFMRLCLYSPNGGFYASHERRISDHFGTSPASHPVFGALIARQLEQMWLLLEEPEVFNLIEVGSGEGVLAQSILNACERHFPQFARALRYVAVDYQPDGNHSTSHAIDWPMGIEDATQLNVRGPTNGVHRVKAEGLGSFHNVTGCIVCNELIDNFPFHRFAIQDGKISEVFVTLEKGNFVEVLGEPSSDGVEQRLTGLGLNLAEGYRGEVCLALEDWATQLSGALERGFVLTIDYGELADDLYLPLNSSGTLRCFRRHIASGDPYQNIGQQDITCLVDFTSLMRLGDWNRLSTVGFVQQSRFLTNLGFSHFLEELQNRGLSAARTEFNRLALMTLVDPNEFGNFKVLAQAKGVGPDIKLLGFEGQDN
jgi:SAM-dependent MidA family methyltransferase